MSKVWVGQLAEVARRAGEQVRGTIWNSDAGRELGMLRAALAAAQGHPLGRAEFCDVYAQTWVCALLALRSRQDCLTRSGAAPWLLAEANPLWRDLLCDTMGVLGMMDAKGSTGRAADGLAGLIADDAWQAAWQACRGDDPEADPLLHFFEHFLNGLDARKRTRRGVYYTPRSVARFLVQGVDDVLRDEFGIADGLADTVTWGQMAGRCRGLVIPGGVEPHEPFVRILDPAAGTGMFLVEVIDLIHRGLTDKWRAAGHDTERIGRLWNDYVPRHLWPRLSGLELMLPPHLICHINLAAKLARTGFRFSAAGRPHVCVANTLAGPDGESDAEPGGAARLDAALQREIALSRGVRQRVPFTVVLGNPPYSGISSNRSRWIETLLKGRGSGAGETASYYEVDGRPLGERKLWLQDDYVKFVRYAQWRIEATGCGVVGYVTNHGYLDNTTFRGMRQQLLRAFPRISVVDLHGNRKKKERSPDGGLDESVFEVEQGVALSLLRRPIQQPCAPRVFHSDVWGTRREKLDRLDRSTASSLPASVLLPIGPSYFFVPRDDSVREEYERGYRLTDIMPVNSTAPVTARDGFVVALDDNELWRRMEQFRDLSIPDEEIRRRFFGRGRSPKYPPGDTRGWKVGRARLRMAGDPHWRDYARDCLYRPFDTRRVYWADWMIDWPRAEIAAHMLAGPNLALIVRRQMLPAQPCNYFWITDTIALDGVIRSDNRGSESVVPLYVYDQAADGAAPRRRANFTGTLIDAVTSRWGMRWRDQGCGDLRLTVGPDDVAHLCYAVFHSPTYRRRYAELLRDDFPRVFLPGDAVLFRELRDCGSRLASQHLLAHRSTRDVPPPRGEDRLVRPGYPKYDGSRVFLNAGTWFPDVPEEVWGFHVGGHQVCRKWLKDRKGRNLTSADVDHYRQILAAVAETIRLMARIDQAIDRHGGWPAAFESK